MKSENLTTISKKIKIEIGIIGQLPFGFDEEFIKKWKSKIFEIVGDIKKCDFGHNSGLKPEEYRDSFLEEKLPENKEGNFSIWIMYVPIEGNFIARYLSSNRVILSYFEIYDILKQEHIPIENFLLRSIYRHLIVYLRNKNEIPIQNNSKFPHDDTRGCIFDMNGNEKDVVYSIDSPKICDKCIEEIKKDGIEDSCINQIKKEIPRIKKHFFYRISDFLRKKPIIYLLVLILSAILFSLIASVIYDFFKN